MASDIYMSDICNLHIWEIQPASPVLTCSDMYAPYGQDIIHFQIKTLITWTSLCEDHDNDLIKHWISIQGERARSPLALRASYW